MPATASELGIVDPYDPLVNIGGGAHYLRNMLTQFGSVELGLAAYNAGATSVRRANGIPANTETPRYVRRVFAYWSMTTGSRIEGLRQTAQLLGFVDARKD
jgi:soluble lytic murein transglycosylase-like protein